VKEAGLKDIVDIDEALGSKPTSTKPFDLSRYYDPSYLAGK